MNKASSKKIGTLNVSPPNLSRFLNKKDRDRSVVLLDVESFCPGKHPTLLFNVILNSIKIRRGTVKRADFHFATMGVELSVAPEGARIIDYTQSSRLSVQYQKEVARTAAQLHKAGGALSLTVGGEERKLTVDVENSIENLVKGSAAFVSTENELVATYRTTDLQWRLDPIGTEKVIRQFQQGNLWLTCKLEAIEPKWEAEVLIRPTEFRAYGADMLKPLTDVQTVWMLFIMWMDGITIRNRDGEVFKLKGQLE